MHLSALVFTLCEMQCVKMAHAEGRTPTQQNNLNGTIRSQQCDRVRVSLSITTLLVSEQVLERCFSSSSNRFRIGDTRRFSRFIAFSTHRPIIYLRVYSNSCMLFRYNFLIAPPLSDTLANFSFANRIKLCFYDWLNSQYRLYCFCRNCYMKQ